MIVFCFDPRWPGTFVPYRSSVPVRQFRCSTSDSVAAIAQRIRSEAGSAQLSDLYLCAHGNSGYMQLGQGLTVSNAYGFNVLHGRFESMGIIHIHGCGVGSDTSVTGGGSVSAPTCVPGTFGGDQLGRSHAGAGYELLRALANHTGAWVEAALNCQYDDPLYTYEGPTVLVTPGGSFGATE
jgi:hypothetical protein